MIEYEAGPGHRPPVHAHDGPHLAFVLEGGFVEEDDRGRELWCPAGSARRSAAGEEHRIRFGDSGARCLVLHVPDPRLLPASVHGAGGRRVVRDAELERRLLSIQAEIRSAPVPSVVLVERLVVEALSMTRRAGRFDALEVPDWLSRARRRLLEDPSEAPSLSDLADEVGVHPVHLSRRFPAHFGMTLSAFTRSIRLETARRLVIESDLPLAEIAHRTGFSDQAHMTRAFSHRLGLPPGRMREAATRPEGTR